MLLKGEKAIDFSLFGSDLKEYKLNEYLGKKVVLVFYPGAFTSVCQKELCTFRDSLANFESLNATILGISMDSPFANKAFKEQNSLSFQLLSDIGGEVSGKYGGVHQDFAGVRGLTVSKRAVFIVNKDGKISYTWVSDDPRVEPDYAEISNHLKKI
ncbi:MULTISPECIES: peroxiredoxin [Mesotoga]|jgi:peroxiredoxin|uniref:peroxiredoxin n=1 Tax=Mesotoga TaxID=1184396 RepID=UPI0002CC94CF|nr:MULTISPECIES: peroxiredoxin [Mesotoga]MCP5457716.1 peroxiredoxin [Thermotogota bacterium]CCU85230.1 Alkyl hydroperoxide reductase/ Thiol specific antioxidant/ Mal allergen [Mesotoga infera]MDK2945102.1 glutaredoxin-dependent peroxiredoxin [Mesotoga sp.]RLL89149.1 alkyl hydroperoxide reductase [Mesotoga sp. H07pep.5.4]RLL91161.1 alkyl hydroperoxide reductase [Mesotoga sp. HF07.pep.5.2.highcov]